MRHGEGSTGQRPALSPISPWWPVVWFFPTAIVLAILVLRSVPESGPLDHADKAEQRTGILIPSSEAHDATELDLPGDPVGQVRTVVVFDRTAPDSGRYRRWVQALPRRTETVLVLPRPTAADHSGKVVTDDSKRIADALRMDTPQDDGFPVGYAVLDRAGRLRYKTLDPAYLAHPSEAATMAGAVP